LQDFIKYNSCKVSRLRARDRNPLRPRQDLRHSRPRLEKTGLEKRFQTETKSQGGVVAWRWRHM